MSIKVTLRNESNSIVEFHCYNLVDLDVLNSQNQSPDPETDYKFFFTYFQLFYQNESYLIV